jgi:hypothetical protein
MRTDIKYPIYSNEKGTNHFGFLFFNWKLWEIIPKEIFLKLYKFIQACILLPDFLKVKDFLYMSQKMWAQSITCHMKFKKIVT